MTSGAEPEKRVSWVRIGLFAVALAAMFMALAIEDAYRHVDTLFACAYWAG